MDYYKPMIHRLFAATLLLAFVGVAVFGYVAMGHDSDGGHLSCIANYSKTVSCPASFESALFHINIFRSFSLTVLTLLVLFLALAAIRLFSGRLLWESAPPAKYETKDFAPPAFHIELQEWRELFEKRDPLPVLV